MIAIVLVAYANAFPLGAAFDGAHFVSLDTRTHAATLENVRTIFTTDYWWPQSLDRLYRPLTVLSFLFNYAVLGNENRAQGYHAVNILLHVLNTLLVFGLVRRLLNTMTLIPALEVAPLRSRLCLAPNRSRDRKGAHAQLLDTLCLDRPLPAFLAAALWAAHPAGVEAVTNIAGRADLLSAAGLLGGLMVYANWSKAGGGARRQIAVLFVCALGAAASKETGIVLIPLMLLWDAVVGGFRKADWKSRAPAYLAAGAAAAIYLGARTMVLAAAPWPLEAFADNPLRGAGFWAARWTAVRILGADLLLLLWPARLASDHSFNDIPIASWADAGAWLALGAVVAIAAAAVLGRKRNPVLLWCAGMFAITLLPASNLIVLIGAPMAERFLYLPSVGFAVATAVIVWRFAPAKAASAILAVFIVAAAARTIARNPNWDTNTTLAEHDATVTPRSYHPHELLAEALFWSGGANRDRAIAELETSWQILKDLPPERNIAQVPVELAFYYITRHITDAGATGAEAERWNREALPLLERADEISRATQRRVDELQREHGKPLARPRQNQQQYLLLGNTYEALRRYQEAQDAYRAVRALDPSLPDGYDVAARAYVAMGEPDHAARLELEKTLAMGSAQQALAALAEWYRRVPDGGCAIVSAGGILSLNTGCPRIREDLCRALPDLAATYTEVRQAERAAEFRRAGQQSGCRAAGERAE